MPPFLCWLTVAFDHLSRRIHVDTSIAELGSDLVTELRALADLSVPAGRVAVEWPEAGAHPARASGYLGRIDLAALVARCRACEHRMDIPVAQGHFLHERETLFIVDRQDAADVRAVYLRLSIDRFRNQDAGAQFIAALLAEIAARALSPAVNDVYTALACIDHLGGGMAESFANETGDGWFGEEGTPWVRMLDMTPRGILARPLDIIRQAAADYPSASIRLLVMIRRLIDHACDDGSVEWLKGKARLIADSALASGPIAADADDIRAALKDALDVAGGDSQAAG